MTKLTDDIFDHRVSLLWRDKLADIGIGELTREQYADFEKTPKNWYVQRCIVRRMDGPTLCEYYEAVIRPNLTRYYATDVTYEASGLLTVLPALVALVPKGKQLPRVLRPVNKAHSSISLVRALKNILWVLNQCETDQAVEDALAAAIDDVNTMLENVQD